MLEIFRKLKTGPVSASALRNALSVLDKDSISSVVEKCEKARREAILSGDAKVVAAAESALTDARLEVERVEIAIQELTEHITAAERREADEALDVIIRAAIARRDAMRRRVTKELAPALRLACEVLIEIVEVDAEIGRANDAVSSAGRGDRIAKTEEEGAVPPIGSNYPLEYPLTGNLTIRPVAEWGVAGWRWQAPAAGLIGFAPGMFTGGRRP